MSENADEYARPWRQITGAELAQGDYLPDCEVAIVPAEFGTSEEIELEVGLSNVVIMTQSCDLAFSNSTQRAQFVLVCPVYSLQEWKSAYPRFEKKGEWGNARRGRLTGVHLLPPFDSQNAEDSHVVDFRTVYSLPLAYLSLQAHNCQKRWRLNSPWTEHLSQNFGLMFMRVGLPHTPLDDLN